MQITPKILEDIISLVSTNMTGEVDTTDEIVKTLHRAGGEVVADFKVGTTVQFGRVKFHTLSKLRLKK